MLKKTIQSAQIEGKVWRQEMYKFLRNYRATPHSTTGISPAQALYGRNIRIKLPEVPDNTPPQSPKEIDPISAKTIGSRSRK